MKKQLSKKELLEKVNERLKKGKELLEKTTKTKNDAKRTENIMRLYAELTFEIDKMNELSHKLIIIEGLMNGLFEFSKIEVANECVKDLKQTLNTVSKVNES